jgi:hypothetical protein
VSAPGQWVPVICSKELAPVPGAVLVGSVMSDDLLPKGPSTRDGLDKGDHAAGVPFGKARTSHDGPSSRIRESRSASPT